MSHNWYESPFTPTGNLESTINLTCMSLVYMRKQEPTRTTCKLQLFLVSCYNIRYVTRKTNHCSLYLSNLSVCICADRRWRKLWIIVLIWQNQEEQWGKHASNYRVITQHCTVSSSDWLMKTIRRSQCFTFPFKVESLTLCCFFFIYFFLKVLFGKEKEGMMWQIRTLIMNSTATFNVSSVPFHISWTKQV